MTLGDALGSGLSASLGAIPGEALAARRWFAGKARTPRRLELLDAAELEPRSALVLVLARALYSEGEPEVYALPLLAVAGTAAPPESVPLAVLHAPTGETTTLHDATELPQGQAALYRALLNDRPLPCREGELLLHRFEQLDPELADQGQLSRAEQSNSSIIYGRTWVLKLLRRPQGVSREAAIGRFLTLEAHFPHVPRLGAVLEYQSTAGERHTVALLHRFVANEGDGWSFCTSRLAPLLRAPNSGAMPLLPLVETVGRVTAELHAALASRPDVPAFAPEPATEQDVQRWVGDPLRQLEMVLPLAQAQLPSLPPALQPAMQKFLADAPICADRVRRMERAIHATGLIKMQIHADYHLGQVLKTPDGIAILDFEGEPSRPLSERNAKQSPLQDVAGMLRSLHYAAVAAAGPADQSAEAQRRLAAAEAWAQQAQARFQATWLQHCAVAPADSAAGNRLLELFQLAKALYELRYELSNRPNWTGIPLAGIDRLMHSVEGERS